MDLYDMPKHVERAVQEAVPFFDDHLAEQGPQEAGTQPRAVLRRQLVWFAG
ncbi:hypothetical protein [Streptomyces sp. NPDC005181]|uniref:hypothetical protein n=1 Tax=Streptomyces sp. NPDC005181 TaxID=3156869 RepID=UPI0033A376CC